MKNGLSNTHTGSFLYKLPIGIYTTDKNGRITYYNQRAAELWGRNPKLNDPSETLFCGSLKIYLRDGTFLPHEYSYTARALKTGKTYKSKEIIIERPDGSHIPILISVSPLYREDRLYGVINILQDISKHKRVEADAWRLAALVESSNDAIISKTLDGKINSWNKAAERMLGYTEQEAVGKNIRMIIPQDRQDEEDMIISRITKGERIHSFETIRRRKDGSTVPVSLTISPIKNEEGKIIASSKIARDITLLIETREKLKQMNQLKDSFIAMVSHELKTPLAILKTYLQFLEMQIPVQNEWHNAVLKALDQEERLKDIVTNLIDISTIEAGKFNLNLTSFNLEEFLDECIENIRLVKKEPLIKKHFRLNNAIICADRIRLGQVVFNLLSNALKFTPKDQPIIINAFSEKNYFNLEIKDFGPGIPVSDQDKVFEIFYRVKDTQLYQGLGIGLYLCKQIIDSHKGNICVESEPGKGATFYVKIPLCVPDQKKVMDHEEEKENTSD